MSDYARLGEHGLLLEAEVAPKSQARFEKRYLAATKQAVSPGVPHYYQTQPGKWGAELRVYFNDAGMAVSLATLGLHVERSRKGYLASKYRYRVNNNKFWWALVEDHGMRLGKG
jgi:hypothetical protein